MISMKRKKSVSTVKSIPAPVGGLNARDSLANMDEDDAVIMDNWFPETTSVNIRNGYESHVTGLGSEVDTLAGYNNGVDLELYAVAGGAIYDTTNSGAVGSALVSGLTNSRFQHINFGTAGGFFLLMVNGNDDLQYYDGSAWSVINSGSSPAITGVDTADCININNFKNRVWLIEKNSLSAWYLPVAAIGGSAQELDLSGIFKMGGYLVTMVNWTIDNAAGIDDYAAFITSQGEVALYKGTNPASSSTWFLVGTFRIGKPLGYKCAVKAGADVLVLTEDGAFPLSKSLLTDRGQQNLAITDKITNLFLKDTQSYRSAYGWQSILHPTGNKLVINVPQVEGSISYQYVMNLITGSWCRFTGWNSFCYEVLDNELYFGGNGVVYKADTGESDDNETIQTDVQQAYSYFGSKAQKKFNMARPVFSASGTLSPSLILNTDYRLTAPTGTPAYTENSNSLWNIAEWDVADWVSGDKITLRWRTITGIGYAGGIRMQTNTKNLTCQWQSTDIVYERGGVL